MTNLEWVRTLTAEELAKLLSDDCDMCSKSNGGCNMDCKNGYIKWLNAEHVPKVKPCPCCGGKAEIIEIEPMIQYVSCTQCIMQTNTGRKNEVIKAWNRRADNE